MATSTFRLAFSPLIHTPNPYNLFFSIPSFHSKSLKILCFSSIPPSLETLAPPPNQFVDATSSSKWEPYRKKKVVMRVGYVGTDYRGLQMQKDDSISSSNEISVNELTEEFLEPIESDASNSATN